MVQTAVAFMTQRHEKLTKHRPLKIIPDRGTFAAVNVMNISYLY